MNTSAAPTNHRILIGATDQSTHDRIRTNLVVGGGEEVEPDAFTVDSAYQGQEVLLRVQRALAESRPYAVVLLDARMPPGWDGVETILRLWDLDSDLQAVIFAGGDAPGAGEMAGEMADKILDKLGRTDRLFCLARPLDAVALRLTVVALTEKRHVSEQRRQELQGLKKWVGNAQRVLDVLQQSHHDLEAAHVAATSRATELTKMVQERTVEAIATRDMAVFAMAQLTESRDPETGEHLARMRAYTQMLAEHLAQEGPYTDQIDERFLEDLYRSSPLHDIGKVGIPDQILLKPGPLTPAELVVMRRHTTLGADALMRAAEQSEHGAFLEMAADIARCHHERFDGAGYPAGLAGERIPLAARIVALADVFDALTSVRIYKDAMDPSIAEQLILEQNGEHFDPAVVEAFRACYDRILVVHAANQPEQLEPAAGEFSTAP